MLMVTCLPSLCCLVVSAKDVPSHLCCIFLLQKFQPLIFFPIPVSLAFPFRLYRLSHSMMTIHPLLSPRTIPFVPGLRLFSLFEWRSGAKLKQCNSKHFWLGSWRCRRDPPLALDWSSGSVQCFCQSW